MGDKFDGHTMRETLMALTDAIAELDDLERIDRFIKTANKSLSPYAEWKFVSGFTDENDFYVGVVRLN